ncbi:MAG TPA: RIP metalloprotease RseP [Terracidiphilus sp.]|nr:RIP metalloprotease RseP [Terracidiphilus sp.]
MHNFLVYAASFIVLIGVMVVVHEFGHFAVAKLCGVRVEAFSIGFGPRLFGIKYGDTDYKVCLLPLGGYVKMTGENPAEEQPIDDPAAFSSHPRWQRMLIGVAGPAANFILAFGLMLFYFGWINEVPDVRTSVLEWVSQGSPAAQAGMQPGDIIEQFGSVTHPDIETVADVTDKSAGQTLPVTLLRNGQSIHTELRIPSHFDSDSFELSQSGMFLEYVHGPINVDQVYSGTPADRAGLRAGDSILAIDGHVFHTLDPFVDYLQKGKGKPVTLTVRRNGVTLPPIVAQPTLQDQQWHLGFVGVAPADPPMKNHPLALSDAVVNARDFCAENSMLIVGVVRKLITRQASIKQLSGPVGIARAAGQAAQTRFWAPKFGLAAGISLNLGILNLLPFPILDGGLIMLLLIESVMRQDISIVIKERIYQAAFVVLVFFFVYVSFNDVAKLSVFSHFKP